MKIEKFFSLLTVPDFRTEYRQPGNGSIAMVKNGKRLQIV